MTKPENPLAFPIETYVANGIMQAEGMSLRDWFAGQALMGLLAQPFDESTDALGETYAEALKRIPDAAYDYAEAMLSEREARK